MGRQLSLRQLISKLRALECNITDRAICNSEDLTVAEREYVTAMKGAWGVSCWIWARARVRGGLRSTRVRHVRLLGPCFKTGRLQLLRQHPSRCADLSPGWLHVVSPTVKGPL